MAIVNLATEPADPTLFEFHKVVENRQDRAQRRSDQREEMLRILEDPSTNKLLVGHWNHDQTYRYCVFLTVYEENFSQKSLRRTQKIFKQMCKFIRTRTADQCRSHHQKMEKKCKTFFNILKELHKNFPLSESLRQSLTDECIGLRKPIFQENKLGVTLIKVEEEKKNQKSSHQTEEQVPEIPPCQPLSDMSIYLQNGYYVMPFFPCSTYYFYTNYFSPPQGWSMNACHAACNKL